MWTKRGRHSINCDGEGHFVQSASVFVLISTLSKCVCCVYLRKQYTYQLIKYACLYKSTPWDWIQSVWTHMPRRVCMCVCWFICVNPRVHMFHIAVWLGRSDCHFLSSSRLISSLPLSVTQVKSIQQPLRSHSWLTSFKDSFLMQRMKHFFPTSLSVVILCHKWLISFMLKGHVFSV